MRHFYISTFYLLTVLIPAIAFGQSGSKEEVGTSLAKIDGFPPGYWARVVLSNPYCGKTRQAIVANISGDPQALEQKIRDALSRFKDSEMSQSCGGGFTFPSNNKQGTQPKALNFWIPSDELERVKNELSQLNDTIEWAKGKVLTSVGSETADRLRLLKTEQIENASLLQQSPNIRALVRAEIERIEPFAKSFSETRDKIHLQVVLYTSK